MRPRAVNTEDALRSSVQEVLAVLGLSGAVDESAAPKDCGGRVVIRQTMLRDAMAVITLCDRLNDLVATFKIAAKLARRANASVEPGAAALVFTDTERRTPQWKEEAIASAKAIADSLSVPFDAAAYVREVQERYPVNVSTSVKVVESGK
jgi:hypothetical protein